MFNDGHKPPEFETVKDADVECGKRQVKFMEDYLAAGGKAQRFIFQSWMTNPTITGPETLEHSFMGITKRQLDAGKVTPKESK